jgi:anti-sigma B factor antagonist
MEIKVEVKDGPPITGLITLTGLVETPQARRLRGTLEEVEAKGVGRIVFDLTEVAFISSTGLSLLVSYANMKRSEWGENPVVLVGLTPAVQKAMQVLGISGLFLVLPDMKSALEKFGLS